MFERRLKILLGLILCVTCVLVFRAGWLQVVRAEEYRQKAADAGKRVSPIETIRGPIKDFKDRMVAEDGPCIDACVDYRAIDLEAEESQAWLKEQAAARLKARGALKGDKEERAALVDAEVGRVKDDIRLMWQRLVEVSGQKTEEIEQVKQSIVRRVVMRKRYVWFKRFQEAVEKHKKENGKDADPSPAWYSWLIDENAQPPQVDSFKVTVSEQSESHVVLRAIENDAYVKLAKLRDRCPWLDLKKSTHRVYPYHEVGAHVVGHLSPISQEDLKKDPRVKQVSTEDARRYYYNDLIGRTGIEGLAELILRGKRGQIVRLIGKDGPVEHSAPVAGAAARITIDMELQMRIQEAFLRYKEVDDPNKPGQDLRVVQTPVHVMHGAAVVIDVPTGQVRALVSYPTYDANELDQRYSELARNYIDQPLLNRATQQAVEPGSTVKPVVGLGAITSNMVRWDEGIECTGYLMINGRKMRTGRCWVASKFGHVLGEGVAHHPVPYFAPHPTGFLTFADGLERSCNVYFETLGDRMGPAMLRDWYTKFGLGNRTGIGIPESTGRIPGDVDNVGDIRSATWFSAIGQAQVLATPIQMANAVATIARRGVWVRPHLLVDESKDVERRDLKLSKEGLDAAFDGMIRVVNGAAGTGTILKRDDFVVAGKTGTAQTGRFSVLVRGSDGKVLRDDAGKPVRRVYDPSTSEQPNRDMPWYRGSGNSGKELGHAWMIGFAPAENPKVAFAVLVEYGGSGGRDAGPVAQQILQACVEHGYLPNVKRPIAITR
jgi:penicillin-binding protein 2